MPARSKTKALTRRTADRHALYQASVQDPAHEIALFDRFARQHTGRPASSLREDFCGTALLCAAWVESRRDRTAVGIDIDRPTLRWAEARNRAPLGAAADRMRMVEADVRAPSPERFDLVCALNYSYSVFHRRADLLDYFRAAHRALGPRGLFVLDAIGGWEAQKPLVEKRRERGFTYVWEQASYDPITARYRCHIHFELPGGARLRRAFTYDWRLWSLMELRELLLEAGFAGVDAYWESADARGEGSGIFRRVEHATNDPGWNAYLVAKKGRPAPGSPDARRTGR